jgi:hypothetical protein
MPEPLLRFGPNTQDVDDFITGLENLEFRSWRGVVIHIEHIDLEGFERDVQELGQVASSSARRAAAEFATMMATKAATRGFLRDRALWEQLPGRPYTLNDLVSGMDEVAATAARALVFSDVIAADLKARLLKPFEDVISGVSAP